jgi:hypothetical protein
MPKPASEALEFDPAAQAEIEVQEAIDLCGGDGGGTMPGSPRLHYEPLMLAT